MSNEIIVRILEKLDLTEAESKVYIYLLKHGTTTAGELAKISAYSRPKVYEILEKLVNLGLAESFPARPIKFRALDPEISISSYLDMKKTELNDVETDLKNSLKKFFQMVPTKERGVFINQGLRKTSAKYCELVKNAEKGVYSFLGWVSKEEIENLIDAYAIAGKNGVVTNIAYFQNKMFKEQAEEKDIETLSKIVTRFYPIPSTGFPVPNPPMKFLLVDDHSVHITLGDYLEKGILEDVMSVHYYNIAAFSKVMKKLAPAYFKSYFSRFKGVKDEHN